MSDTTKTAVDWLFQKFLDGYELTLNDFEEAKKIEQADHATTWMDAIKAHEDRGHNTARSICDFDEYYIENFGGPDVKH